MEGPITEQAGGLSDWKKGEHASSSANPGLSGRDWWTEDQVGAAENGTFDGDGLTDKSRIAPYAAINPAAAV